MCGCPVYHYDHMVQYSQTEEHDPANLVLLCPTHHQDKTSRRLSTDRVKSAAAHPFNQGRRYTSPADTYYDLSRFSLQVGNIGMTTDLTERGYSGADALNVDGGSVIGVRRDIDNLSLYLRLCNSNNEPFLDVRKGEIRFSTQLWDVSYEGIILTIRDGLGEIRLELDLTPDAIHVRRGRFWSNGYQFEITREGKFLSPGSRSISEMTLVGGKCVFYKGVASRRPQGTMIDLQEDGRMSWSDP